MITAFKFVELTGVSVMGPEPLADTPVRTPMTEEVQLKVVPPIDEVGKKLNDVPLQISCIRDVEELVITGFGLSVTTMSTEVPEHPFAVGVIR